MVDNRLVGGGGGGADDSDDTDTTEEETNTTTDDTGSQTSTGGGGSRDATLDSGTSGGSTSGGSDSGDTSSSTTGGYIPGSPSDPSTSDGGSDTSDDTDSQTSTGGGGSRDTTLDSGTSGGSTSGGSDSGDTSSSTTGGYIPGSPSDPSTSDSKSTTSGGGSSGNGGDRSSSTSGTTGRPTPGSGEFNQPADPAPGYQNQPTEQVDSSENWQPIADPDQGLEETADDQNIQRQASEFERDFLEENEQFSAEDVRVVRESEDKLGLELTATGEEILQEEAEQRRAQQQRDFEDALKGLGFEGVGTGNMRAPDAPGSQTLAERKVEMRSERALEGLGFEGVGTDQMRAPNAPDKQTLAEQRASREADFRSKRALEGLGFEGVGTDNVRAPEAAGQETYLEQQARQEQLGDYDINIPGTDRTVEGELRDLSETGSQVASISGSLVSGGWGEYYRSVLQGRQIEDAGALQATMEQDDRTQAAEALGDFTTGAVEIANVPQVGVSAIEAGEWGVYVGSEAASGSGGVAVDETWDVGKKRAGAFADYAKQNRAEVAGMGAGALVGSAAIMGAAGRVSSRAGAVSRYAIQPGEEVAGKLGNVGTRALAGERTAERLFPNNEPLIFSEEAAIRTAGALGERARRVRTSDSFGYTPAEQRFTSGGVEASGPRIGPALASEYDQSIEGMVWEGGSRVRDVGRPEQRTLYAGERGDLFTERNPLGTPMEGERELADRIQETYQRARYPRRGVEGYDSAEGQFDPTQANDVDAVWVEGDVDEAAMPDVTDPENIQPFEGSKVATTPTSKIDTGSNRVLTATESEVETQETGVAVEQTRPDAYESPGRLYETNLPGLGRETAVGEGLSSRGRGESLLDVAQEPQARTGLGSESLEFELGRELTAEFERSGLELNTEQETRAEVEGAYENALEMELEQELELEQEIESGAESRIEFESDSMTSNTGRLKGEFGGVGPQDTLLGDDFLSSGWLSESTADVATQATRQAGTPSQDVLEARPIGERLSGELPTKLELTGSKETKKDIEAVRDLFSFGGGQ